jgi:hypothetical protein
VTALDVVLAILGIGITGMVVAGMVLLVPRNLVSPAVQTDLSDVKPHHPAGRNDGTKPTTEPAAEPGRDTVATFRASLNDGDRPAGDRRTRVQPKEHS